MKAEELAKHWAACEVELIMLAPKAPYVGTMGLRSERLKDWVKAYGDGSELEAASE